ncbi:MAG TPA: peptidoglycan-binding protein [Acidimicrobiia bacterium]|nr:peptidoglycan-binding protein [Acidimicrobiia bacterium]
MRLYRIGDSGDAVRDIQGRLLALGYPTHSDPGGEFGEATQAAVRGFQTDRGLTADGEVGPETWRVLYEAGYRLGDRLLFLRRPMLRGEDVAELQGRLSQLGFDPGKVDGIFGLETEQAVLEFQRNRVLTEDGIAGPEVLTELRLLVRGKMRAGRETVREREWLRTLPASVVGSRVFFDAACRTPEEARAAWAAASSAAMELQARGGQPMLGRSADTRLPERVRAGRANRLGAELVVSFQIRADGGPAAVFYFASDRGASRAGEMLANRIAETAGGVVEGRATAILRDTRAPSVIISHPELGSEIGRQVVEGLTQFFATAALETTELKT